MVNKPVMEPHFTTFYGAEANLDRRTIKLAFGTSNERVFKFDLSRALIGGVIAYLCSETRILDAQIPEAERDSSQLIMGEAVQVAQAEDGSLVLMFDLKGGASLPLSLSNGDMRALGEQILALTATSGKGH